MTRPGGWQMRQASPGKAVEGAVYPVMRGTVEPRQRPATIATPLPSRSRILAYHQVVPEPSGYLYSVTGARFEEHLQFLCGMKNGEPEAMVPAQVTFDDGHITCYRYALPLLEQHHAPATFFVTTEWIGRRAEVMTWAQLGELVALGHRVQSHGWRHKLLTHCSDSELREELYRSKRMLEDRLGSAVNSISAPGGRWNRRTLRTAAAAGYQEMYLSDPWLAPEEREGMRVLGRLMVHHHMDARRLRHLLELRGAPLLLYRALYGAKEAAKSMLGDAVYQRLWRWVARHDQSYAAPLGKP